MTTFNAPLWRGFDWRSPELVFVTAGTPSQPLFPGTARFRGAVKTTVHDAQALALLTTEQGHLLVTAAGTLVILLPGTMTAAWRPGTVVLDLVRTDVSPQQHLGTLVNVTILQPPSAP